MICPKCRQPADSNAQYCGSCGQRLDTSVRAQPEAQLLPAWSTPGASHAAPGAETTGAHTQAGAGSGAGAFMPGLLARVKAILLSPRSEWVVIEREETSVAQLVTGYVIPLAVLAVIVSFVRMSILGVSLPFGGSIRTPVATGLTYAVMTFVAGVVGAFIVGVIINWLAPTFGGTRDQRQALKTAAYALTPAWLGTVFTLLPSMGTLLQFIAGIYGIYVLYLGLPVVMRSRQEKAGAYTATVVVCTIVLAILLGALSAAFGVGRAGALGAMSAASEREVAREQGAAAVASVIGGALGTDEKGKAGLANALSNMAKAGEQLEAQEKAARAAGAGSAESSAAQTTAADATSAGSAMPGSASTANATDAATNAAGAAGGLLTALGGALGGGRHVEPVDFHTLESWLPKALPGMSRTNLQGAGQQALGVKSTSATASYRGDGDARIEIKVSDASGVAGLMDLAGSLGAAQSSEDDNGYERQAVVGGRSVHEKYDSRGKHAELQALVAKRFAVDMSGEGVPMEALEESLGHLDLAALEALKDAGAKSE